MATKKDRVCECCGEPTSSRSGLCLGCQRGTPSGSRRPTPRAKRPLQDRIFQPDEEDIAADFGDDSIPFSQQQYDG